MSRRAYTEAIAAFDRLEQRYRNTDSALEGAYRKGVALREMNRNEDARRQFEQVRTDHPNTRFSARSTIGLARIMEGEGNVDGAKQLLRTVVSERNDEVGAEAQYLIGAFDLARNNYQEAITQLLRVRYVFPNATEWVARSYLGLGEAYEATNQTARARDTYETLIQQYRDTEFAREAETKLRRLGRS